MLLGDRSLVPLLKTSDAPWKSTAITAVTYKTKPDVGYVTIRNELGRYIRYTDGQEEYYDTTKDPHEWTNAIDKPEYAPVVRKIRAAIPSASDMATPLPCLITDQDKKTKKQSKKKDEDEE